MFRFKKIAFPRVSLSLYVNCTTTAIVPPRLFCEKWLFRFWVQISVAVTPSAKR